MHGEASASSSGSSSGATTPDMADAPLPSPPVPATATRPRASTCSEVDDLRRRLTETEAMVRVLQHDTLILNEKLVDATERRAEIQASNDLIARELDVLTEKLFEEANTLVSRESRRRYAQCLHSDGYRSNRCQ